MIAVNLETRLPQLLSMIAVRANLHR